MENARPALNWGTDLTLQKTKYIQVWRGDLVLRARASAPGRARRRRGAPRASGSRAAPSRRSSPAPAGRTDPVRRRAGPRARGGRSAGGARGRGLRRGFGRREGRRVTPPEGESALETARAPPRARLVGTRAGGWGLCVPRPASPPPSRVPGRAALSRPRPRQGPSPGKPLAPSSSPPTSKPRLAPRHSACAHSACSPVFPAHLQAPPASEAFCLRAFCLLSRLPRLPPSPAHLQGILLARILLTLPSSPPTSKRAFCLQGPDRRAHPQPWHPHTHPISMGTGRPGPRRSRRGPDPAASAARSRADWAAAGGTGDRRVHGRQNFRASRPVSGPPCGIRTERNSVSLRSVRASARPGGTGSPRPAAG